MRIVCIGSGPAGLYFAILMELRQPHTNITVIEHNKHDDTFGWGLVLIAAKNLYSGNPQQRFIQTDEIAATALWLCNDGARSINGHALSISGGEI